MIRRIRSDRPGFRTVEFGPGFNVVLAERSGEAGQQDSRNGVGKSTLVEIIAFCLGARLAELRTLKSPAIRGWTFYLDLDVAGRQVSAGRNTESPQRIIFAGDASGWPIQPAIRQEGETYTIAQWTSLLGTQLFGLDPNSGESHPPTFRSG